MKQVHSLSENMNIKQAEAFKIYQSNLLFLIALLRFCIRRKALNMVTCRIHLPLKEALVTIFKKACKPLPENK